MRICVKIILGIILVTAQFIAYGQDEKKRPITPGEVYKLNEKEVEQYRQEALIDGNDVSALKLYLYYALYKHDMKNKDIWVYIAAKLGNETAQLHLGNMLKMKESLIENAFSIENLPEGYANHKNDVYLSYLWYMHCKTTNNEAETRKMKSELERLKISPFLTDDAEIFYPGGGVWLNQKEFEQYRQEALIDGNAESALKLYFHYAYFEGDTKNGYVWV